MELYFTVDAIMPHNTDSLVLDLARRAEYEWHEPVNTIFCENAMVQRRMSEAAPQINEHFQASGLGEFSPEFVIACPLWGAP